MICYQAREAGGLKAGIAQCKAIPTVKDCLIGKTS